jgi:acyl dehydratase
VTPTAGDPDAGSLTWTVRARNTAVASSNKIHDDAVARDYGFAGGLVPGAEVYAYLSHVPAARWGRAWLERGTMHARFLRPVYDGETVDVTAATAGGEGPAGDAVSLSLTSAGGGRAEGGAALPTEPLPRPGADTVPVALLPDERPPASEASLAPGRVLGSLDFTFEAASARQYLDDIGETLPLYRQELLAHPGWFLRAANLVLTSNVVMGPWVHVASAVTHHAAVEAGTDLSARGVVRERFERRGHKFVVLDILVLADGQRTAAHIEHTAIYELRRNDGS